MQLAILLVAMQLAILLVIAKVTNKHISYSSVHPSSYCVVIPSLHQGNHPSIYPSIAHKAIRPLLQHAHAPPQVQQGRAGHKHSRGQTASTHISAVRYGAVQCSMTQYGAGSSHHPATHRLCPRTHPTPLPPDRSGHRSLPARG